MRVGVFGGTFNPVHLGHLLVADDVLHRLRLDRILVIPAFAPPHRTTGLVPYHHRRQMVRLALRSWPGLSFCPLEERLPVPSYTTQTLRRLRAARPQDSLYLILGADQYRQIASWREPAALARLARLLVMARPGKPVPRRFRFHDPGRVSIIEPIQVDISAALIRRRLANRESVRYMLPVSVLKYIRSHRLYN